MKNLNTRRSLFIISMFIFFQISCEKSAGYEEPYIDPHIIFTSRRWWNYDIYITDIYGVYMTHLTKNKWLDFKKSKLKLSEKEIKDKILKRNSARVNKNYELADKIRKELLDNGVLIEDKDGKTVWKFK